MKVDISEKYAHVYIIGSSFFIYQCVCTSYVCSPIKLLFPFTTLYMLLPSPYQRVNTSS